MVCKNEDEIRGGNGGETGKITGTLSLNSAAEPVSKHTNNPPPDREGTQHARGRDKAKPNSNAHI